MYYRVYAHGPPNNGKTNAIVQTALRPMCIINAPGETGYDSIPVDDPDIVRFPSFDPYQDSAQLLTEVEKACSSVIREGKYKTVAFEGIHNLLDYAMDKMTDGNHLKGIDSNDYGRSNALAGRWMDAFLSRLMVNTVPLVIITGWSKEKGERRVRKGEKPEDVPQIIGPLMMGEYSRTILGRVPMVFHQTLRPTQELDAEGKRKYLAAWQTRPHGMVKGVGIKAPKKVVDGMPLFIPADYGYLIAKWEELSK
jgi:hypothetical protein